MRTLVILALVAVSASSSAQEPATDRIDPLPAWRPERPGSQVVLEFGLAMPRGDLADDFNTAALGFGAKDGLELGFRWRFHLSQGFSVAPFFHFIDYADHDGYRYDPEEDEEVEARIKSSVYSFGLEARYALGAPRDFWRPFAAASVGIDRNRVEGWQKDYEKVFDRSVNSLGLTARAGVRLDQFELSLVYRYSRFSTWRFFDTGIAQDYVWDAVVARAGWILSF